MFEGWGDSLAAMGNGLWGGAKDAGNWLTQSTQGTPYQGIFSDPRAYLGAAGTLGGMYSNYQARNAQQEAMKKYIQATRQPVSNNYYNPMSDAEAAARNRAIKADLVTRGIPLDSAYATHLTAEGMAGTESQRFKDSMQYAQSDRQRQLEALGSRAGMQPAQVSTDAFGNYLNTLGMQNQQQKTMDQMRQIFSRGGQQPQQPGAVDTGNLGMNDRNLQLGSMGNSLGADQAYGDYQGSF